MKIAALNNISDICSYVKDHVITRCTDFFTWWAGIAYDFPYRLLNAQSRVSPIRGLYRTDTFVILYGVHTVSQCICATLVITLLCCTGLIPGIPTWIDGADALYSLPFSQARSDGSVHASFFSETRTRPTFVIVTGRVIGENILTWKHLEVLQKLDQLIRGKTLDKKRRRIGIPKMPEFLPLSLRTSLSNTYSTYDRNNSLDIEMPSLERSQHVINQLNERSSVMLDDSYLYDGLHSESSDKDILTFEDICDQDPFGECSVSNVLEMDLFDIRKLQPDKDPVIYVFDGVVYNTKKKGFPPHYLLGNAEESPCTIELPVGNLKMLFNESRLMPGSNSALAKVNATCIKRVEAFHLVYELIDKEEYRARNEAWEKALLSVLDDNMYYGPLKIVVNAFRSRDDALRSSTSESSDILFAGLTFGLIILYSSGLNFSCDLYKSKSYPALSGVIAASLGMIAGIGFMSLCGIAFVPTALVCPFLIIGVGTDDMFVIINSYTMSYMVDSPRERCILSLRDTGLAITVTTVTSLVSFFIGLNTDYISIKNFCYFCAGGMFFGYIFVMTFFFPCHCLDARREFDRRLCLFHFKNKAEDAPHHNERQQQIAKCNSGMEISTFTLVALMVRRAEHNAVRNYGLHLRQRLPKASNDIELGPRDSSLSKLFGSPHADASQTTSGSVDLTSGPQAIKKPIEDIAVTETSMRSSYSNESDSAQSDPSANQLSTIDSSPQCTSIATRCVHLMTTLYRALLHLSDYLLTNIAVHGHHIGMETKGAKIPANGILIPSTEYNVNCSSKEKKNIHSQVNVDIVTKFSRQRNPVLYYRSLQTNEVKVFFNEPPGTVGRRWRQFLIRFYGPVLLFPPVKIFVIVSFTLFTLVSIYGCLNLKSGLELKELAPTGSYLNLYDITQLKYFGKYDFPVDIFFPNYTEWWKPGYHTTLQELHNEMLDSGASKIIANPLLHMLSDQDLKPSLGSGDRELFQKTLRAALMKDRGKYKQFEQNFVWEGSTLRAWKMQMLPGGMGRSSERAEWMTKIRYVFSKFIPYQSRECRRAICEKQATKSFPLQVMPWNYMMTYYESDLQINSSVVSNLIVAAFTMFIISVLGMPAMRAAFLVIVVMAMIDVGIIGFMFFWNVRMNMVSMICLLIAVGFSVDFSAHVCHTFMETQGQSRDQRVLETLVLMGNAVFHGAISSILGVLMLGFSQSYIFLVFFKMMALVMTFALVHSVVFLPVILSVVGNSTPHVPKGHELPSLDFKSDGSDKGGSNTDSGFSKPDNGAKYPSTTCSTRERMIPPQPHGLKPLMSPDCPPPATRMCLPHALRQSPKQTNLEQSTMTQYNIAFNDHKQLSPFVMFHSGQRNEMPYSNSCESKHTEAHQQIKGIEHEKDASVHLNHLEVHSLQMSANTIYCNSQPSAEDMTKSNPFFWKEIRRNPHIQYYTQETTNYQNRHLPLRQSHKKLVNHQRIHKNPDAHRKARALGRCGSPARLLPFPSRQQLQPVAHHGRSPDFSLKLYDNFSVRSKYQGNRRVSVSTERGILRDLPTPHSTSRCANTMTVRERTRILRRTSQSHHIRCIPTTRMSKMLVKPYDPLAFFPHFTKMNDANASRSPSDLKCCAECSTLGCTRQQRSDIPLFQQDSSPLTHQLPSQSPVRLNCVIHNNSPSLYGDCVKHVVRIRHDPKDTRYSQGVYYRK